jgi:zeaxanthin glucosyltransferase
MPHFGIVCPPVTGHVNPLAAVGRALIRRGHRVTFFHVPDMGATARAQGLEFSGIGLPDYPPGALPDSVKKLSELTGTTSLKYAISCACRISNLILRDAPDAMSGARVDAVLVDQNEPAGGTVAEHLRLPFVSVCTSLPLNRETLIPPPFVPWTYSASPVAAIRNKIGYAISDHWIAPINETLNRYRKQWKLSLIHQPDDSFSQTAQIAQMPREFDFPRRRLPATFQYLGPWFDRALPETPFPFEKLDGRPLIYGSIGTLQSANSHYFRMMAEACAELDAQLILTGAATCDLPGKPLIVQYAPQIELLSRAAVTITHAGMNTMQQSLYFGVPPVAIPLAHDQPAIAARLARTGAGIVIPPKKLTVNRLREAVRALLQPASEFRTQARLLQEASRAAGGVERAADIAERL